MREAMFYEQDEGGRTFCRLCPKLCNIREGKTGFCRVRKNEGGTLYSLNFGHCAALAVDPVEKKPLYHFYPGHSILSLGASGCNLHCGFCQNWHIAHSDPETRPLSPGQAADLAAKYAAGGECAGVAYTYSEPFMWYEFVYETSQKVREKGLKNVLVTNGYVNPEPLEEIIPYIDAMNIDVKAFTDQFYKDNCVGKLAPVLRTVELSVPHCHVEITTLLVNGLNDSEQEIRKLVDWVAGLDPSLPLHISRYFPNYKMDREATPLSTMEKALKIAKEKLNYVYIGNAPELDSANTVCPHCGELLVRRTGYYVNIEALLGDRCTACGKQINLVR
ncbi:MAG: AmmeMemoRadiSam system radical SAM enzyme [Firmicutes bacterium]|nr:AmmeMemoRadiSam system radical SAM enzyme [Bacillota bacterium]